MSTDSLIDALLRISAEGEASNQAFYQTGPAAGSPLKYVPDLATQADRVSFGIFVVVNRLRHKLLQRTPGNWMIAETSDDIGVALCCAMAVYETAYLHQLALANEPELPNLLDKSIAALFSDFKIIYSEATLRRLFEKSLSLKNDLIGADHPKAVEARGLLEQFALAYTFNRVRKKISEEDAERVLFGLYDSLRGAIEQKP